jgi:lipoprotein-anchoring transpeptidase ErfK/SrfK
MVSIYAKPGAGPVFAEALPGARLPVFEEQPSGGACKGPWLRVQYRGWVCSQNAQEAPSGEEHERHAENRNPTQRATTLRETPLYESPWAESHSNKKAGEKVKVTRIVDVGGVSFAQLSPNTYVRAEDLSFQGRRSWSSPFSGVSFGSTVHPPHAFFVDKEIPIYAEPGTRDPSLAIAKKQRYETAPVLSFREVDGLRFAQIAEGWFPLQAGVTVAEVEPRPESVPEGGRWVLVDLSEQLLVAYDGDQMVFATLISSGRRSKTVTGTFPLTRKFRHRTMAGEMFGKPYRVDDVPWAQYFQGAYALHGAFWHDKFGYRASHGCVNLTPADALTMANFLEPVLPAGWWSIYPPEGNIPTSTVIVRE